MKQPPNSSANRICQSKKLARIQETLWSCIQCGVCTGSCPNASAMDYPPRRLWRLMLMNRLEEVLLSKTFALCSSCYYCTLGCPRGLPLTEIMSGLKQIAMELDLGVFHDSATFYESFLENVRQNGRVQESEMMTRYFVARKNPLLPFQFAPLGIKLLQKGKITPPWRKKKRGSAYQNLAALFAKVKEVEKKL